MGLPFGVKVFEDGLKELSEVVQEYYGALVEVRNRIRREPIPEMPLALMYTLQIRKTGHLLMAGGLLDQPYLFMQEYKTCLDLVDLFEAILSRPLEEKK